MAELIARQWLPVTNYTFENVWGGQNDLMERGVFEPDPELGFRPGPVWRGKRGRLGFMNGAEFGPKKGGEKDLAVLGDSIVIFRTVERALNLRLRKHGFRVWNAGITGYNTLQEAIYLEKHIGLKPDFLILIFCLNDFLPSMVIVPSDEYRKGQFAMTQFDPLESSFPFLYKHSALYRYIKVKAVVAGHPDMFSPENIHRNRSLVYKGLDRIRSFAETHQIGLFVMVYPSLSDPEEPWEKEAHALAVSILEELGIRYVTLRETFRRLGSARLRRAPEDMVHPNFMAHQFAVEVFLDRFHEALGLSRWGP